MPGRRSLVLAVALVACGTDLGGRVAHDAATDGATDGGALDAPTTDARTPSDGALDDVWIALDASATVDAGTGCTPIDCTAACGPAPDGCGGTLGCDACTDDVWCAPAPAMYADVVRASVESVMAARPELFDPVMFRDTSSWLVIDDAGYTAAVVAACNAMGLVCISDPNDDHEIRVRAPGDHLAENYGIRTHATNRTWYRFMGGVCETLIF